MTNNEADILSKYQDVFPQEFIESVRKGVSWLCTHNNITYQTSIMVASDRVLYNTAGTSVLRIGLINTDLPLTGLTYYEVKSIEVAKDEVSGSTVFNVKMKYTTPMGLTITLVPIIYFDPEVAPEFYSKSEIDIKLNELKELIDNKADGNTVNEIVSDIYSKIKETVSEETVTKLETKVDDMLQSLALDYVTNEKLDEELAKVESGDKELDLTTYLKVKDAEEKYATKESVTEVDNKVTAINLDSKADKTELEVYAKTADIESKYLTKEQGNSGYVTTTIYAVEKANLLATQAQVDEKVEAAKTELSTKVTEVEGKVNAIQVPSVDGLATTEYVNNKVKEVQAGTVDKDEVVAALKQDSEFKLAVKGDTGETGAVGPSGKDGKSVTVDEVKPVVVEALKQDDDFKNSVKGTDGVSPSAADVATAVKDEVVTTLKADTEFKESVKGEKGEAADVSTLATKAELANYLKSETAETTYAKSTELANKADSSALETKLDKSTYDTDKAKFVTDDNKANKLIDYLTKTEASTTYQPKATE